MPSRRARRNKPRRKQNRLEGRTRILKPDESLALSRANYAGLSSVARDTGAGRKRSNSPGLLPKVRRENASEEVSRTRGLSKSGHPAARFQSYLVELPSARADESLQHPRLVATERLDRRTTLPPPDTCPPACWPTAFRYTRSLANPPRPAIRSSTELSPLKPVICGPGPLTST